MEIYMEKNTTNNTNIIEEIVTEVEKLDSAVKTAKEILELPDNLDIWVVKDLIPKGCTILAGAPKSYKTYLSIHIANCLITGNKVFGKFEVSRTRNTLIIDRENPPFLIKKRLHQLEVEKEALIYWNFDPTPISDNAYKDNLFKNIKELDIDFLVVDSFRRFHPGDENSSESVAKTFQLISEIKALGVSVLIVHHLRKESKTGVFSTEQMLRGSSDLIAYPDAILGVKKMFENPDIVLKVEQPAIRAAEGLTPFNVGVDAIDDTIEFCYRGAQPPSLTEPAMVEADILKMIEDKKQVSRKEIHEQLKLKFSRRVIDAILKNLIQGGKLVKETGSRGKHIFRIPTGEEQLLLEVEPENNSSA